ncbi:MAG TPA: hypothetical protein VGQ52_07015, partial [Gemmatimonadaceae bacterium]|nr:hypothetical protein [Gemmatimonadaceae bacterium]
MKTSFNNVNGKTCSDQTDMPDGTEFGSSLPKHFHKPWPATSEVFGSSFTKEKAQLAQRMRRVL